MWPRSSDRGLRLTLLALLLLLPIMLLRLEGDPVTIDSLICARSVAEFEPGFLDGKPAYALLGQPVRALNALIGGDRATLVTLLAAWCSLFAWGTLIVVFLIGRDLYAGSTLRGWAAVVLLASTPTFLFMSAVLDKYTVTLFFQALAVLLWLRRRYAPAGLAWGVAVGAHAAAVLLVVPFAASLRWDPSRKEEVRPAFRGALAAVLVAAPLYGWVLMHARSVGGYFAYLYRTAFGDYSFLAALRPDRFFRTVLASAFSWVVLLLVAAVLAGAWILIRRRRGRSGPTKAAGGRKERTRLTELRLVLLGLLAVAGLVLSAYWQHLFPFFRLTGWVLIGAALLRLALLLAGRAESIGDAGRAVAGATSAVFTLLIPWLASMAIFFMTWDHFFGQFSMWVAPPLALLAAGLGAHGGAGAAEPGRAAERRRAWASFAMIGLAALASLWLSRDIVDRVAWPTRENDVAARAARGALEEEGVLIAAWDGPNYTYHHPGLTVLTVVSGMKERPPVWRRDREFGAPLEEIRAAVASGRSAYVTQRFLDQPDDDPTVRAVREEILRRYALVAVSPGVRRLAPHAAE